ncbi:hypothetical protein [Ulvibacterium sp.]|uniref:hypothetical protein n=1 Tax=Ulvibacterium sp. TaxID=2665914 RepID=UPI003CC5234E
MKAFPNGHAPMLSFYSPFGLLRLFLIACWYRFNTVSTANSGANRIQNTSNDFLEGNRQGPVLFETMGQGCLEFNMNMVQIYRAIGLGCLWRDRMKFSAAFLKRIPDPYNLLKHRK